MESHAINLRSDHPALLVEFRLPPCTHARIGASAEAEISIPLAGLADIARVIGRDGAGRVYLADADGERREYIQLPAALPLPPYQFVIFEPAGTPPPGSALAVRPRLRGWRLAAIAISAAMVVLTGIVVVLLANREGGHFTDQTKQEDPDPQEAVQAPHPEQTGAGETAQPSEQADSGAEDSPPVGQAKPMGVDLGTIAELAAPAVFRIDVRDENGETRGTGTAFRIAPDGVAVTNEHVASRGYQLVAIDSEGSEFPVEEIIVTDTHSDLALLRIASTGTQCLELGTSENLRIGAPVAVFGAPQGLAGTLSAGILSARRTSANKIAENLPNNGNLLQITAPISPGSSGSPVFDEQGKVIGVAAASHSGDRAQNLNIVIPVEAVARLVKDAGNPEIMRLRKLVEDLRKVVENPNSTPAEKILKADEDFLEDPRYGELGLLMKAGEDGEALKLARRLAAEYPGSPCAHHLHAVALITLDLAAPAETAVKRAIELDPAAAESWEVLGFAQLRQGKREDGRSSLQAGLAINPDMAGSWRYLAVSLLADREFRQAITPLENLRRLDRGVFEDILALVRAIPGQESSLRQLKAHFAGMATDEIATPGPVDAIRLAESLVAKFLRNGSANTPAAAELADYAVTVDPYFDHGRADHKFIARDIAEYRKKWPIRDNRLIEVEQARRDEPDELEATYRMRFSTSNGKTGRSGVLRQWIRYERIQGKWVVTGVQTVEKLGG